jgi:hypothetical protein
MEAGRYQLEVSGHDGRRTARMFCDTGEQAAAAMKRWLTLPGITVTVHRCGR